MGLYEDILERIRNVPDAAKFPELYTPPAAEERDPLSLPRLSDLPQNLLPPHLRNRVGAVDASAPGIQSAIGNAPAGPAIPAALRVHAGMLPPLNETRSPFMTEPEAAMQRLVDPNAKAEPVPMPRARPDEAPYPDDGSSPAPQSMGTPPGPPTDVGARSRAPGPLQIAPAAPPAAALPPQAGMLSGGEPSFLSRIRDTLGNNSNTLLAIGAGLAGAPNIGQGISRAAAAAIPARAADIKQSLDLQSRAYGTQALRAAGVPAQLAIAAQGDPELKKALIKNYIEDRAKKIIEIGQDPTTGAKIFAQHDPFSGELTPIDMSKFKGGAGGGATADNEVTGPDYMQHLKDTDPAQARRVDAIVRGDDPFPTGKAALTPMGARLIRDVQQVEPGSSQQDFKIRQGVRADYASGPSSKVTKSVNTTVHHGALLEKAITDMNNFTLLPGVLNPLTGAIQKQYDPKYQAARKSFISNAEPFVKELDYVLSGGKPTVSGQKELRQMFDIDGSTEENMASLHKAMDLLNGRLQSHTEGFVRGTRLQREPIDFIDPVNKKHFAHLLGQVEAPAAAAPAPAAAAPKVAAPAPGRYVFDPATGALVPAK